MWVPHDTRDQIVDDVRYWTDRDEPERGEQYAHDLPTEAIRQLSDPGTARAGRHLHHTAYPETQECRSSNIRTASFTSSRKQMESSKCCAFGTAIATNHSTNKRAHPDACGERSSPTGIPLRFVRSFCSELDVGRLP